MFPDTRGKSCGLKMYMSQRKRPVTWQPLATVTPVAAWLYFPNSLPSWYMVTTFPGLEWSQFSFLGNRIFWVPQGLRSVGAVRWKANYDNSGCFVAAHFLVAHRLNSCLHPSTFHLFL
jgi:hypothetical protein